MGQSLSHAIPSRPLNSQAAEQFRKETQQSLDRIVQSMNQVKDEATKIMNFGKNLKSADIITFQKHLSKMRDLNASLNRILSRGPSATTTK